MKKILLVYTFSKMSLGSCGTETVVLVKFFLSNFFFSIFFFFYLKKLNHSLLASEFQEFFLISFGVCLYFAMVNYSYYQQIFLLFPMGLVLLTAFFP